MAIKGFCLVFMLIFGTSAVAQEAKDEKKYGIKFGGLPFVIYDSDQGVGFGAIGYLYKDSPTVKPYSYSIGMRPFFSLKGYHAHRVDFDALDIFGSPLRILSTVGFFATQSQNYCGMAGYANCNPDIPAAIFDSGSTVETDRDRFIREYYAFRYLEPWFKLETRTRLKSMPHKIEFLAAYRASLYIEGDWWESGPYVQSKFANDFPAGSQDGYAGVFQVGAMFDSRDNEPTPTKGYWAEATLRGSSSYLGSHWDYWGYNATFRGYVPLGTKKVVFASQTIADGIVGDAALAEIVRVGGSETRNAFGGIQIGRGVRDQHFPGKVKFIQQVELRYHFIDFKILTQKFSPAIAGFGDSGITYWDFERVGKDPLKLLVGFGLGLRFAWNDTVLVRFDVASSPHEGYLPRYYLTLHNAF